MCLVVYTDVLATEINNIITRTLESPLGQNSKDFADALYTVTTASGDNALTVCHKNGWIKKIQTSQVLMTPTSTSTIRLDELNTMLDEMEKGEDAIQRLADLDKNQGLSTDSRPKQKANPLKTTSGDMSSEILPLPKNVSNSVLSNSDIAKQQLSQATKMKRDAAGLLAEAARLESEASLLDPTILNVDNKQIAEVAKG